MNSPTKWNPLQEVTSMQRRLDHLFDEMWRPLSENGELTIGSNRLALDIHEDNDNYTVVTEFPGVKADDIHVKVEGDMLHIEGEIPEQTVEKEDSKVVVQERRYGRYSRSVRLPKPVDTDKVDANYKDGVLTLTLPIKEEVKPRAIPVKVKAK